MKFIITAAAVLGYGLWAYFANCYSGQVENPEMVAMRAGIIQGGYAGLLTLINVYLLEILYLRLSQRLEPPQAVAFAVLVATIAQYSLIVPVHILNGTPNIIITLLPGFLIGTAFSVTYTLAFKKKALSRHALKAKPRENA